MKIKMDGSCPRQRGEYLPSCNAEIEKKSLQRREGRKSSFHSQPQPSHVHARRNAGSPAVLPASKSPAPSNFNVVLFEVARSADATDPRNILGQRIQTPRPNSRALPRLSRPPEVEDSCPSLTADRDAAYGSAAQPTPDSSASIREHLRPLRPQVGAAFPTTSRKCSRTPSGTRNFASSGQP